MHKHALTLCLLLLASPASAADFHVAPFSADVTIPIGHRCMGILETKAARIADPLFAKGFVLIGAERPIVFVSVDWCEIRNAAYDHWRAVLAEAAGTTPERVLVSSVHQHDAPVVDLGAEKLLAEVGLASELCDVAFHETALQRVAEALRQGMANKKPITHIGLGQATVEGVASNRRVERADGTVVFDRGSASGGNKLLADAPDGLIDPQLKTLSFWDGDTPRLALHAYATHPMSYYGRGEVTADFVGIARRRMQERFPGVFQIYASGCSGDVTAGKYNDGSPENRPVLAERMLQAMESAWNMTEKFPLSTIDFRNVQLALPFNDAPAMQVDLLEQQLADKNATVRDRILAAMGLASWERIDKPIDMPCVDFGVAQLVLFPGESFVGYQRMAQELRPDSFVMCVGFSECWPGYIPTQAAFEDRFGGESWRWVAPGCETRIRAALSEVLQETAAEP